ncbi:Mut7-C RNAse domain-containing protein [Pseudoduganella armeniaca]|uniref:Twitching motility protein PilT n=1 Tax=Pseudoduganella armeniaca TaxID=2072590 RepID=A0A2R4CDG1_9BURK|nr:Mut7-C RNAse domain-containing protein [Pseudoduganella armeniaca]AVR97677.1 twitching motility protein PilT [Pseudoduganella armeniaca]
MVTATFRFDSALDPFLPRERRGLPFTVPCARAATVKHMVEALGVPHTEAGPVTIDGRPALLDELLADGASVHVAAVAPVVLASLEARFVADAHLGGLARFLRMAGFDTLYDNAIDDPAVEASAQDDGRIALTRDRELLKRRGVLRGAYVRALKPEQQLQEVFARFGLAASARPFTLCLACNAPLRPVPKADVEAQLPPSVRATHEHFLTCDVCQGVFWQGSHWRRMRALLDGVAAPDAPGGMTL